MVLPACGSAGDPSPNSAGPTSTLTIWVYEEPLFAGEPRTPLADVEIAFDPPEAGERQTLRTDPDGRAIVKGDFSSAGGSVTAISKDHLVVTALDASPKRPRGNPIGKPPEDVVLVLPKLDTGVLARSVEMKGTLIGKTSKSVIDVSTSILPRLGNTVTDRPNYALRAVRDRPFVLVAHEQTLPDGPNETPDPIKSFRIDVPARDVDGTLDLDIANAPALKTQSVHVRATLPPSFERCSVIAQSAESTLLVGAFRHASIVDGSSCDAEMTVADVTSIAPETAITTTTLVAADGARLTRVDQGIATDGARVDGFLTPLAAIPDASRKVGDPIPNVERPPPGATMKIEVFANEQLVWVLDTPTGGLTTSSVTLPKPAISFSADVTLLAIVIVVEADPVVLPSGKVIYRRSAMSRDIIVRR